MHQNKSNLYLKIRIPREDSTKDNERKEEKDFREKISIMEQFFRNIHELAELSLRNIVRTTLFNSNIVSFEIVAQKKLIDFYIVVPKIYRELIEKQVTSYYPNADIVPVEKYALAPKGNKLRMYYAYAKEQYWFPFKTYKTLENDPLNDLTNIFSKLEDDEVAGIQLVFRPIRSRKYNKKSEKIASTLFKGKEPPRFNFPGFNFIYNLFAGLIGGYEKMRFDKPNDQTGFVRMLQPLEERAKKMGEKASSPSFRVVMRFFGSAPTISKAENITNNVNYFNSQI